MAESTYEERYRFPAEYARLLFICVAFTAAALFLRLPPAVRIGELVLFGGGAIALLVLGMRGLAQVAVRVDDAGLTVGSRPSRFRYTADTHPWPDVRGVRLNRPEGTPPAPVLTVTLRGNRPPVPLPIRGWRVDPDRLAAALAAHAPKVKFVNDRA